MLGAVTTPRSPGAWLLLGLFPGCVDVESVPLPETADWLVVQALSRDGELLHALGPAPSDAPLPFATREADGHALLLEGYDDSGLSSLLPEVPREAWTERFRASPLRAAVGCEPRLPAPQWRAQHGEGDWVRSDPPSVELTADWMVDRCDERETELWVDTSECGQLYCPRERHALGPCAWELALPGCGLPSFEVRRRRDQDLCAATDNAVALGRPARLPVRSSPSTECVLSVEERTPFAPRLTRWSFAELVPSLPTIPDRRLQDHRALGPLLDFWGAAATLVVLPDRILVSAARGPSYACVPGNEPSLLIHFPRTADGLGPAETSTAPPCMFHLEAEPGGQTFIGAHDLGGTEFAVTRFDRRGRALAQGRASIVRGDASVGGLIVHPMGVFVASVAALTRQASGSLDGTEGEVFRFDPDSLELQASWRRENPNQSAERSAHFSRLIAAGPSILMVEERARAVERFDPEHGFTSSGVRAQVGSFKVFDVLHEGGGNRFFASGRSYEVSGFVAHGGLAECFGASGALACDWTQREFPGRDFLGLRLTPWPADERRLASFVAVQEGPRLGTWLAAISLEEGSYGRYLALGAPVAEHPVGAVRVDGRSLWALVPDQAVLLRIDPGE